MKRNALDKERTKFFGEDVVQRIDDPPDSSNYGIVMRCWHDNDDIQLGLSQSIDPLLRPLKRGEVGVSFYPTSSREILPDTSFRLIDRPMQAGDICKRSYEDAQSAVVTNAQVRFKVAHAVSGTKLEDWKTVDDVKEFDDIAVGDFVAYNDWVGQIQEFFDESVIQTSDGLLVHLPEISARLAVGDRGPDILPKRPEGIHGLISYFMGEFRSSSEALVLSVKHTVFAVAWMAINQMLTPEQALKRQRPKRFWSAKDISGLTLLRGVNDQLPRVGDRLVLKTPPENVFTVHSHVDQGTEVIRVETFVICETETTIDLLWQNGSTEKNVRSIELIPYLNPDEYDCWPGDHVVWKTEEVNHGGVVQSVSAEERTAEIALYDGRREVVSVLELDAHGKGANVGNPSEGFGVRRGDLVFIHGEGESNRCSKPTVPSIGELEPWVYEIPFADVGSGTLSGWGKELDQIGQNIAEENKSDKVHRIRRPIPDDSRISWFGEVTDLHLNGLVQVTLPDSSRVSVPLERVTRLRDDLEDLDDPWGDELSERHSVYDSINNDGGTYEIQTEDGRWQQYTGGPEEEWVDEDEDEVVSEPEDESRPAEVDEIVSGGVNVKSNGIVPGAWPSPGDIQLRSSSTPRPELTSIESPEATNATLETVREQPSSQSSTCWKRFDILPSAPPDHTFISSSTGHPSKQFIARLSKEYRALSSSLPETIIVRTYEDRMDLLRSLTIGPENTPYEDAPFVIDWKLDANFPQSPPIAHFYSWTNGNGRVNPNLYEEGKVCLSILGTWEGDRNESWSPSRSSLLQAFVSIQGLVLVKEPWYCEPAFEKFRGTDEGKVNSRLYSEKAYVLSRGFLRRALEVPLVGLEDVIQDIYITRGRLAKVIRSTRALIERSKSTKESEDDASEVAVPRLTGGGIIPLTRTLERLEAILAASGRVSS